jgi:hypothetical protein
MSQAHSSGVTIPSGAAVPSWHWQLPSLPRATPPRVSHGRAVLESGPSTARRGPYRGGRRRRAYLPSFEDAGETFKHDKEKRGGVSEFTLIARIVHSAIQRTARL